MKIKDLRLALSATPKKPEIRYYLNGVNVTKVNIVGSAGYAGCYVHTYANDIPPNHDSIIVPVATVKALLKKTGAKHENSECRIALINDRYEISCANEVEVFVPMDCKYPDFKRILNRIKENNHDENLKKIQHQFNWQYIADANNAVCKYMGNTTPKRLYSCEGAGYFMPAPDGDVIYMIMPFSN